MNSLVIRDEPPMTQRHCQCIKLQILISQTWTPTTQIHCQCIKLQILISQTWNPLGCVYPLQLTQEISSLFLKKAVSLTNSNNYRATIVVVISYSYSTLYSSVGEFDTDLCYMIFTGCPTGNLGADRFLQSLFPPKGRLHFIYTSSHTTILSLKFTVQVTETFHSCHIILMPNSKCMSAI